MSNDLKKNDFLPPNSKLVQILTEICILEDIDLLASKLIGQISPNRGFCVWLTGPLGAGKTTVVSAILYQLGLSKNVPVLSPTYTIMADYNIKGVWYGHLDLYRLMEQASLEDLGILDAHDYGGIFVEWPERCSGDPCIHPTHLLELGYGSHEKERFVTLSRVVGRQ
jgi:tRNA threonylcarbamoyl adenosine modification protein YjeE